MMSVLKYIQSHNLLRGEGCNNYGVGGCSLLGGEANKCDSVAGQN